MSIRPISSEELAEWELHPAKEYIREPLGGMIVESMPPEDLAWILAWRKRVAEWVESEEATTQGHIAKEAGKAYAREVEKLHALAKVATYPKAGMPSVVKRAK